MQSEASESTESLFIELIAVALTAISYALVYVLSLRLSRMLPSESTNMQIFHLDSPAVQC